MKYIISAIGKTKNQQEDLITDKYLKRIKNTALKIVLIQIKILTLLM